MTRIVYRKKKPKATYNTGRLYQLQKKIEFLNDIEIYEKL